MIAGRVSEDGVPLIELSIAGVRWLSVVDTGFSGELELPEVLRSFVNARFAGRATSLLAANQRIEEDFYTVDFPFDGAIVEAEATFVDGDQLLIGTGMLQAYRLEIDFPANTVAIVKL